MHSLSFVPIPLSTLGQAQPCPRLDEQPLNPGVSCERHSCRGPVPSGKKLLRAHRRSVGRCVESWALCVERTAIPQETAQARHVEQEEAEEAEKKHFILRYLCFLLFKNFPIQALSRKQQADIQRPKFSETLLKMDSENLR